jgi:hypothetical protein
MAADKARQRDLGFRFLSLAILCIGLVMLRASTYPCHMRDDLGEATTRTIGVLVISAAWFLQGWVAGKNWKGGGV